LVPLIFSVGPILGQLNIENLFQTNLRYIHALI
jgi:hypothetical protein